jgi:eukaryotic-like serine/threonine-protein kinase
MAQQRYSIIHKLDAGGMAEVWKGKATSMRGFEKLVAIKRVLPDLSKKETFIKMFLDEARLSLHLNHANVVQTFDIGSSDDAYFIVMEWVDGINLKGVLESLKLNGQKMPVEQAIFVTTEICKGLFHAHRRCAPDGSALNIVHRDISPPNILMSREGEVKLVDFGLAKAATQALTTEQGMVKGKFSYLSPEAAWGRVVDERADIFAAGALLWEMLAGRRLFDGKSNKETVLLIREANIPSLDPYNPYIDPLLKKIISKSLTRDPEQRYSTAKDFGQDLSSYLYNKRMMVTNYDIAELIETTLEDKAIDKTIDQDWLDDVGQVEQQLVQFTSLEDLQRMSFRSVADEDERNQRAILPNAEDPRAWAAEMGLEEEFTLPPMRSVSERKIGSLAIVHTEQRVSEAATNTHEELFNQTTHAHSFTPQAIPAIDASNILAQNKMTISSKQRKTDWIRMTLIALIVLIIAILLGVFVPSLLTQEHHIEPKQPHMHLDHKKPLNLPSKTDKADKPTKESSESLELLEDINFEEIEIE